mmetsp:Transcript_9119/g.29078  ORF Transcript_9119/g.29078 Transcript_9119/m.29078 type:complete len:219 (+) Transcript_9119:229-885(+)
MAPRSKLGSQQVLQGGRSRLKRFNVRSGLHQSLLVALLDMWRRLGAVPLGGKGCLELLRSLIGLGDALEDSGVLGGQLVALPGGDTNWQVRHESGSNGHFERGGARWKLDGVPFRDMNGVEAGQPLNELQHRLRGGEHRLAACVDKVDLLRQGCRVEDASELLLEATGGAHAVDHQLHVFLSLQVDQGAPVGVCHWVWLQTDGLGPVEPFQPCGIRRV